MSVATANDTEDKCFDKDLDSVKLDQQDSEILEKHPDLTKLNETDSETVKSKNSVFFSDEDEEVLRTYSQEEIKLQLLKQPKKGILKNRSDLSATVSLDELSIDTGHQSLATILSKEPEPEPSLCNDQKDDEASVVVPEDSTLKDADEVDTFIRVLRRLI